MGPDGFQQSLVYLRTAYSVDPRGWAKFDYVKMPDYRWGILLAPQEENRVIPFGENFGQPAWQEVPGEHRATLRRLIVIQGDPNRPRSNSNAISARPRRRSMTCAICFRSMSRRAAGSGRWCICCRSISAATAARRPTNCCAAALAMRIPPRMLGAFNEATPDWLSFFMFTYFTDRDGKMQLHSLAQSGFDPLSRTCRFMLTEEAHHMFVGETGISRVVQRTCEAMKAAGISEIPKISPRCGRLA